MSFFCRLSGKHYWCIPHRSVDNRLVQVCYECGAERPARELHKEVLPDWFDNSLNPSQPQTTRLDSQISSTPDSERPKALTFGQNLLRRLALVK